MKNFRTPLILLGVLLILSSIAYWDEWQTKKDDETKKGESKLFTFDADAVNAVELTYTDNDKTETVKLAKQGETWQIISPVNTKAEMDEVKSLIKNVREYSYEKKIIDDKNRWNDFGLTQPRVAISLKAGDKSYEFRVGNKAPVGYSTYVAIGPDDNNVYMGSQYIDLALSKKLFDLRQKHFVEITWDKLSSFEYQRPNQATVILTKGDNGWTLNGKQKADEEELKNLVSLLNTESAAAFLDQPSKEMQKAFSAHNKGTQVVAKISWQDGEPEKKTITFLTNNDELYAAYDPTQQIFRLNAASKSKLSKEPIQFQYRKIFLFDPDKLMTVTVDGRKYVRSTGNWIEEGKTDNASQINLLLTDLLGAKTDRFEALQESALKKMAAPTHRLLLEGDGNKILVETWADKTAKEKHLLRIEGNPTLYRVDAKVLLQTSPQPVAMPNLGIEEDHGIEDDHHGHDHG